MNWLTARKSRKLEVAWEYRTKGILWRLIPSQNGYIVLEDRDVDAKSVSFACLRADSGEICWKDKRFEEQWWVSVEAIHENIALLHEYATPDMPDHKKIIALDLNSGNMLWSNNELKFLFAYDNSVYVNRDEFSSRRFFELDLHDGKLVREIDDRYLNVLQETIDGKKYEYVEFPLAYTGETASSSLKESVMPLLEKDGEFGLIEYLEKGEYLIVSYYQKTNDVPPQQKYQQHLVILQKEKGEVVYKDILTTDAPTSAPDTFFGMGNSLFYVKNKNILCSIDLSQMSERGKN